MVGGGNKPHVFSLKDLNLFTDSHIRSHLDPTYGFIYASLHYIKNVYILKNSILPVDKKVIDLIKKTFRLVGGQIQPVKGLSKDLKPIEVGRFLAHQYVINNILNDRINDLNKKVKIITYHVISAKADKKKGIAHKTPVNYSAYIVDRIDIDIAEGDTVDSFIKTLVNYKITLGTKLEEYMNINYGQAINKFITKKWKLDNNENDILMYHIVLAILWYNADSKAGIEEYYKGVNEVFKRFGFQMIDIPVDFSASLFTHDEIDITDNGEITGDDFNFTLASIYYYNNKIHLNTQDYTYIYMPCSMDFPDCGEVALRNFIQLLITRDTGFDLTLLEKYGAIEPVKEYFKYFKTNLQVSNDYIGTDCFKEILGPLYDKGIRLKSRDAWGFVVSNLGADVRYQDMYKCDNGVSYNYEILDGLARNSENVSNMLAVIRCIFTEIKEWEDFNDDIVEVENNLDNKGFGDVHVSNTFLGNYTMKFMPGHYDFLCDAVDSLEIEEKFEGDDMVYLALLNGQNFQDEKFVRCVTKNGTSDDWIYHLMRDDNYMIDIINSFWFFISVDTYKKLVDYTYINFDVDKFRRTDIEKPMLTGHTNYEYTNVDFINLLKSLDKTSITHLVVRPKLIYNDLDFDLDFDFDICSGVDQLTSLTIEADGIVEIFNIDLLVNLVEFQSFHITTRFKDHVRSSYVTTGELKDLNKLNKLCIHTLGLTWDTTILERLEILEVHEFEDFEDTDINSLKTILQKTRVKTLHVGENLCKKIYNAEIRLPSVEVFSVNGTINESDKLFKLLPNIKVIRGGSFSGELTMDLPNLIEIFNVVDIEPFMKYLPQLEGLIVHLLENGDYLRKMPELKKLGFANTHIEQLHELKNIQLVDLDISRLSLYVNGARTSAFKDTVLPLPATLTKLSIKNPFYIDDGKDEIPLIYINNVPNITHITVRGYKLSLLHGKDDSVPTSYMYLKVVDVPNIELFLTETNTTINEVYFQDSDASNIDSLLGKLPNLTHVSFPREYYSNRFTSDKSPLDTCEDLEVIRFDCRLGDNMTHLGDHLEKLAHLREIYFNNNVSNTVFKHLPVAIKKLIKWI